jgi:hypothetical protein
MTHPPATSGPHRPRVDDPKSRVKGLYVVNVRDTINPALAGHEGTRYTSPPQPRDQALALVQLLLGRPFGDVTGAEHTWTASLAGGRRTITLVPAA